MSESEQKKMDGGSEQDKTDIPNEVKTHWINYTQDTTIHGLNKLNGPTIRVTIWILILLLSNAYLAYTLYVELTNYLTYPTTTKISLQFSDSMEFPAVTICNLSKKNGSRLENTPQSHSYEASYTRFARFFHRIDWDDPYYRDHGYFNPINMSDILMETMDGPDFLRNCSFDDNGYYPCANQFKMIFTPSGICFTFNRNGLLSTSYSGSEKNLHMSLNIHQEYYTWSTDLAAGVQILVHDPAEFPNILNHGFRVAPSTTVYASIKQTKYTYLSWPYKAFGDDYCSENLDDMDINGDTYKYTRHTCLLKCRSHYIQKVCGCTVPGSQVPGILCSKYQIKVCYSPAEEEFDTSGLLRKCQCELPCSYTLFTTSVSTATYPSNFASEYLENFSLSTTEDMNSCIVDGCQLDPRNKVKYIVVNCENENNKFKKVTVVVTENNDIFVKLYFHDLTLESVTQTAVYSSIGSLLGNIGGQMGVFIGASFMSLAEVSEFLFVTGVILFRKLCPKNKISKDEM